MSVAFQILGHEDVSRFHLNLGPVRALELGRARQVDHVLPPGGVVVVGE
jgi:hypothetical protein